MTKAVTKDTLITTSEETRPLPGEFEASMDLYPAFDEDYDEINKIVDKIRNVLGSEKSSTNCSDYEPVLRAFIKPLVHKLCRKVRPYIHWGFDPEYRDDPMVLGCEMQSFFSIFTQHHCLDTDIGGVYPRYWKDYPGPRPQFVYHCAYHPAWGTQSHNYVLELNGSCLKSGPSCVFRLLEAKFDMPLLAIVRGRGRYYGIFESVPNIVKKASRFLGKMGIYAPAEQDHTINIPVPGSGDARLSFVRDPVS